MATVSEKRVAFVTGGASGIGRATVTAFADAGYAVAIADRDESAGKKAEAEVRAAGGECLYVVCDVTDDSSVKNAVNKTVATFGGLHAAFNAAGIEGEHGNKTADCTNANWERVLLVDLTGTFLCMKYEIKAMLQSGGGSIVNCASVAGLVGAQTFAAYVAAKHGVVGLTKTAALEYARDGVRVNAICPGTIDTAMNRTMDPAFLQALLDMSPMGKLGSPECIAASALWLCDPKSDFLTGQAIAIDGGWTSV